VFFLVNKKKKKKKNVFFFSQYCLKLGGGGGGGHNYKYAGSWLFFVTQSILQYFVWPAVANRINQKLGCGKTQNKTDAHDVKNIMHCGTDQRHLGPLLCSHD